MAEYMLQLISQLQQPLQNEHDTFFISYKRILRPGKSAAGQNEEESHNFPIKILLLRGLNFKNFKFRYNQMVI